MANNCCKYFTVSLVPIAALILAVVFGCAVVALPVLWIQLATKTVVCWVCVCVCVCVGVGVWVWVWVGEAGEGGLCHSKSQYVIPSTCRQNATEFEISYPKFQFLVNVSKSGGFSIYWALSRDLYSLYILYTHTQYSVVIDAGSAHTDIYIYSWKLPFLNGTGLVTESFNWSINGNLFSSLFSARLHCTLHTPLCVVCVPQWSPVVCVCLPSLLLWEEDRWRCSLQWLAPPVAAGVCCGRA